VKLLTEAKLQAWPWAGLIAGVLGGGLAHQIGSDSNHHACWDNGAGLIITVGLLCLLLVAAGAFLSWQIWRRREHESRPRSFIALVSMLAAGFFAFAIVLPMIASLIIPRCFG
jgi:hypothetical protein